jgi:hypothetical protein
VYRIASPHVPDKSHLTDRYLKAVCTREAMICTTSLTWRWTSTNCPTLTRPTCKAWSATVSSCPGFFYFRSYTLLVESAAKSSFHSGIRPNHFNKRQTYVPLTITCLSGLSQSQTFVLIVSNFRCLPFWIQTSNLVLTLPSIYNALLRRSSHWFAQQCTNMRAFVCLTTLL